jgi:hypothetical protein
MAKTSVWITVMFCALAGGVLTLAQETQKAGLWLISTTNKIQQAGEAPANFGAHPAQSSPETGALPACMTREMVDKYGVILPPSLRDCELSNVVRAADNFHADMTCKGAYNGVGSIEATWTDPDHVTGKVHFVSKTRETTNARSLTWSQDVTAVFKSPDCGDVKPRKMPVK